MKSARNVILKIGILSCLAMGLLMVCGWGVFAQEGKSTAIHS